MADILYVGRRLCTRRTCSAKYSVSSIFVERAVDAQSNEGLVTCKFDYPNFSAGYKNSRVSGVDIALNKVDFILRSFR